MNWGKFHGIKMLIGVCGIECFDKDFSGYFLNNFIKFGEGNGNPLQCSCLENPRDGGAWWAAIYGVTQSQTRLKRLSSNHFIDCCKQSIDCI